MHLRAFQYLGKRRKCFNSYQGERRLRSFPSSGLLRDILILIDLFKVIAKIPKVVIIASLGTFLKVVKIIP
jgi:hypothetical protein